MGDKTNRACVLVKANTIEIRNLEIPTIATDSENVLIQVQATGICGSDVGISALVLITGIEAFSLNR